MNNQTAFNITFIGDEATGKTTFVCREETGEFKKTYTPTRGAEATPLHFYTNKGEITINVWDTAGLSTDYWPNTNLYVIFYDVSQKTTFKNVPNYIQMVREKAGDVPIIVVGAKADPSCMQGAAKRQVAASQRKSMSRKYNVPFLEASAKYRNGVEKMWASVVQKLTNTGSIQFTGP